MKMADMQDTSQLEERVSVNHLVLTWMCERVNYTARALCCQVSYTRSTNNGILYLKKN